MLYKYNHLAEPFNLKNTVLSTPTRSRYSRCGVGYVPCVWGYARETQ